MSWVMVRMSPDDISKMEGFRLQTQFEAIFMTALAPKDAAMFGNRDTAGGIFVFYFSPTAANIFASFLAKWAPQDCSPPSRDSVSLLVGHAGAWDMLPPHASSAG